MLIIKTSKIKYLHHTVMTSTVNQVYLTSQMFCFARVN